MKNIFLLFLLFILNLYLSKGQSPAVQWQKTFGGTDDEVGNEIHISSIGSYLIFGSAGSQNGDVHGNHSLGFDAWLIEVDSASNLLAQKCYGGIDEEEAISGFELAAGYVFIGSAYYNNGDVSGVHGNSCDIWVVKTDSAKQLVWQRCYGSMGNDYPLKIRATSDGGYIFLGEIYLWGDDVVCAPFGESNFWVVKIDSSGNILWQTCLGNSSYDYPSSVICTRDKGFLVYGAVWNHDGTVTCPGSGTVWLAKLDSTGAIVWDQCYPSSIGVELIEKNDGSLVLVASTSTSSIGGYSGTDDYWVYKTDSLGNILHSYCYGGTWVDKPTSISLCADGGVIVAGFTMSFDGLASGNHGGADAFVVKLDSSGNREWSHCYGGSLDDYANSILQTPDGGFIFTGSTTSIDGDITSVPHGGKDLWVVKLAPPPVSVADLQNPISQLTTNYSNGKFNINFSSKTYGEYLISMYDLIGKVIFSKIIKGSVGSNQFSFELNSPSGIKILRLQNANSNTTVKVFTD